MKRHSQVLFGLLLTFVSLALGACDALPAPPAVPTIPTSNVSATPVASKSLLTVPTPSLVRVIRGTITQLIKARGRVSSRQEASLYFTLRGVISQLNVNIGEQVQKGAVLAKQDTFDLEQSVDDAQFNFDQANFQLGQAQARSAAFDFRLKTATDIELQTRQAADQAWQAFQPHVRTGLDSDIAWVRYNRFQDLNTKHLTAAMDLNTVKSQQQEAALDVDAKKQAVQAAQRKLERAQKRLTGATLTAPISGLVLSIDKKIGDEVSAFDPIGIIADPQQLQLQVDIPEDDISSVRVGEAAIIVLDGFPNQKFSGQVKDMAAKPSIYQGKNMYRVIVAFDNAPTVPATIRMGADVSLIGQSKDDALIVPSNAVVSAGTKRYVTSIQDGKPQRIEVHVGIENETLSEILSGISEGSQIQIP